MLTAYLSDGDIARSYGYIYLVYAQQFPALYIGETAGPRGAIGRLGEHLSSSTGNTFFQRLAAHFGDGADPGPLGSVNLAAWKLSSQRTFHSRARDHREAVEFIVQYRLINELQQVDLALPVLSRVRPNPYTGLKYVVQEAERCLTSFVPWLASQTRPEG